jgi:hypothetical protein
MSHSKEIMIETMIKDDTNSIREAMQENDYVFLHSVLRGNSGWKQYSELTTEEITREFNGRNSEGELDSLADEVMSTQKTKGLEITIRRTEGPSALCKSFTCNSFEEANKFLSDMSFTAPTTGGYDKCDFKVVFGNESDDDYSGRYDLKHYSVEIPDLAKRINDNLNFHTGRLKPDHMEEEQYQHFLSNAYPTEAEKQDAEAYFQRVHQTLFMAEKYPSKAEYPIVESVSHNGEKNFLAAYYSDISIEVVHRAKSGFPGELGDGWDEKVFLDVVDNRAGKSINAFTAENIQQMFEYIAEKYPFVFDGSKNEPIMLDDDHRYNYFVAQEAQKKTLFDSPDTQEDESITEQSAISVKL